mgnify:CR=1 FL=1
MSYFICAIASIIIFNFLVLAFITWKIGLEGVMLGKVSRIRDYGFHCVEVWN